MSGVRVRGSLMLHPMQEQVRLQLGEAIENVAKAAGIPEHLVSRHLDDAVVRVLDQLGDLYVSEMSRAVERLGTLRAEVAVFYERALKQQLSAAGEEELRGALQRLRTASLELVTPDAYARRQRRRRAVEEGRTPEPVPAEPESAADRFAGVDDVVLRRPSGSSPGGPVARPRWQQYATERRIGELSPPARAVLRRARLLSRSVQAVLDGQAGAVIGIEAELAGLMNPADRAAALAALAEVRFPGESYALGGGLRGARPPSPPVQAAYSGLRPDRQAAVSRAIGLDPDFVRAITLGEVLYPAGEGLSRSWRAAELDQFCAEHGFGPEQRAALEQGLDELNAGHRAERRAVEEGIGDGPDARSQAVLRRDQAADLGLPIQGRVAEALRGSAVLRDLGNRNPDELLRLAGAWLDHVERHLDAGEEPLTLAQYVQDTIMAKHVRGMLGELTAVYQLAADTWVLKAPDLRVTEGGTDYIVVMKESREVWLCDNKTLSETGLGEVTSLVENIGQNLVKDAELLQAAEPGIARESPEVAAQLEDALRRVRSAAERIEPIVRNQTKEQIRALGVQNRISAVLAELSIRRVITNSGGELLYLTKRLQQRNIDLANLRSADVLSGLRELRNLAVPAQPRTPRPRRGRTAP
jgi:hypothetical protein